MSKEHAFETLQLHAGYEVPETSNNVGLIL